MTKAATLGYCVELVFSFMKKGVFAYVLIWAAATTITFGVVLMNEACGKAKSVSLSGNLADETITFGTLLKKLSRLPCTITSYKFFCPSSM
jgi:hypothetical protein